MSPEELFEQYKYLAKKTIYKMYIDPRSIAKSNRIEYDDLLQYSYCGLWKACLNYKESESKFSTFAINHIRWHVTMRLKRDCNIMKVHQREKFEDDNRYEIVDIDAVPEGEDVSSFHEIIPSDANTEGDALSILLQRLVEAIAPERTIEILKRKLNGESNQSIANTYGLTREAVRMDLVRLKNQLREVHAV